MSGEAERPSWGFLALLGLIGGGPTFVGTVIGQAWVSEALQVAFFARRRRLDPLRRHPAARRLPPLRAADRRRLVDPRSGCCSASPRISCSSPPAPEPRPTSSLRRSLGAFFHAVGVFFHHLADVSWGASGSRSLCHVIKLLFRARAWQNIIGASYPRTRLKFRAAAGAYIAGVGVNSIAPARGGDLVKLYLVKHRVREATYPTLALDARRRDDLRLRRRRRADDLGALDRRAADAPGLLAASRPSTGSSSCATSTRA